MMNPTIYLVLALSAAVLTANAAPVPVLDVDGNQLDGKYYVLPANSSLGGGLALRGPLLEVCPHDITLESSPTNKGIPIKFYEGVELIDPPEHTFVAESEDMAVGMEIGFPPCLFQPFWTMEDFFVEAKSPDDEVQEDNEFQVMKVEGSSYYKFVHCHGSGEVGTPNCRNIGLSSDKRLAKSDEPLLVYFKKAN